MINDGCVYKVNNDGTLTNIDNCENIYITVCKERKFGYKKYLKRVRNRIILSRKLGRLKITN